MEPRVTIVGGGPAGALLAWLLSSRGIETLLVERQSDFERAFRGEILMPSGLRALADAGVDLAAVDLVAFESFRGVMNGRTVLDLDLGAVPPPVPTAVSQASLLEHLVAQAESTGKFALRRGTVVRRIERGASGRWVLHCRTSSGETRIETEHLIGADGRGSVVRRTLDAPVVSRGAEIDVVWFQMAYPEAWTRSRALFMPGHGHLMIATATANGLMQIGWVLLKGVYGDLKSRSIDEWVSVMRGQAEPELAAHLADHAHTLTRPFLLNVVSDRVLGWARDGALLIGDAAHTMSPVGGQGLNIALRDAIVAANELVPVLRSGGDFDAAAARVEAIRAPEVDRIQRIQALPPKVVMGRTRLHSGIRRLAARLLSSPFVRSRAAGGASLFLDGVTRVELEV